MIWKLIYPCQRLYSVNLYAALFLILRQCPANQIDKTINILFAAIKPASLAPLDISKAKMFSKKRHGSSPDSGIADMRGYAPYYPSSESMNGQAGTGQHFQYTGDIQEDCAPQEEQLQNTSFQETIPGMLYY